MITAPLYPMEGSDPARKAYESKLRTWRDAAKEEAVKTLRLNKEFDMAPLYLQMLQGEFWDRRRPRYLSGFFDNRLEQARYSTLSLLTDIRPTVNVGSNVAAYGDQAKIAEAVIHHEWLKQDLDLTLVGVVDAAMLFGNGFCKLSSNTPGSMTWSPCGPDVVMPIQPGNHIQDSSAILYRTYKPLSYFQRIWPSRCANLEQEATTTDQQGSQVNRPPHISEFTWNALSPQMKYRIGLKVGGFMTTSPGQYPVIELQEYWVDDLSLNMSPEEVIVKDPYLPLDSHNYWYRVKPMERLYPRKRLIVYAGNRLMYDGPSPYWHGLFPFAMLRLNPVMWSFWGLSKYRSLVPLNKAINEIGAGTLDMIKRALNPQMITREGAVPKDAWERYFPNMPGGKLRLGMNANVATDIRYMDAPVLPSYVFAFLAQYLAPEFDRLSGSMDIGALTRKGQVPGGESIEQMRDAANPYVRLEGRQIEAFLRDAGTIAISNVFQFYTRRQRLMMMGAAGLTFQDFDKAPGNMIPESALKETFWKNFAMEITPGSLTGTDKMQEKQIALTMFRMGAISRGELLRRLQVPNIDEIQKELEQERQDGTIVATLEGAAGGRTPRLSRSQRNGENF